MERDRFGLMFSGPLEVGECRTVVSLEEANSRIRAAYDTGYEDGKAAGGPTTTAGAWRLLARLRGEGR